MAGPTGKKYNVGPPKVGFLNRSVRDRKYFYIDGKLYNTIRADRPNDILRAWSFADNKVVDFSYTVAKKYMQQAYDTDDVARMLNRTKDNIYKHLAESAINPPVRIGENKTPGPNGSTFGKYKWSEDDILALHSHYLTVGSGRPRKDGMITAAPRLPSRLELIAMMKQNRVVYVKDEDGNFVPIFEQPDWT